MHDMYIAMIIACSRMQTGLDPAGPLFESQDPRVRLDATDANFVDVIHSNGEQLILGGLGSWQPMGDVDYYPNGGKVQSGCSNIFLGAVSDIIWCKNFLWHFAVEFFFYKIYHFFQIYPLILDIYHYF